MTKAEHSPSVTSKPMLHESWIPKRLRDVSPGESGVPIVDGMIYKGGITLLSAREKVGKTTLINLLMRMVHAESEGTFLGQETYPAKALYISEEGPFNWSNRRDDGEAPDELLTILQPFGTSASPGAWEEFCDHAGSVATSHSIDLIVFDTWAWMNPSESENNNTDVVRALKPVQALASAGFSILLIHHQAKGGGIRGGTALPAGVDMIIEMTRKSDPRFPGDESATHDPDDRFRRFELRGRYPSPSTIVARWNGDDYEVIDGESVPHARTSLRQETLYKILVKHGPLSAGEIREHWPQEGVQIGASSTLKRDLKALLGRNQIEIASDSDGGGNDPHLYQARIA